MTGNATKPNLNCLKGKIASLSPYALDQTLSVFGSAAEASAVGEALGNKVSFGDIVDDLETEDSNRPLSARQGVALANDLNDINRTLGEDIDSVRSTAEDASRTAGDAVTVADNALKVAEDKVSAVGKVVNLPASKWSSNKQTVAVEGVTAEQLIIVVADPSSFSPYATCQVRCSAQAQDSLTFTCNETPTVDLKANILILE
jgi:hypothetical protein